MDNVVVANIKSLALDMINEAGSGHPGIVLSAAPILYCLYANHLNINTSDRNWFNRDRFIMSAGHGSALLYATLFMSGFNLSIDDLKKFRKIDSKTPGHPEVGITPGVECSTGPLGQGIATAVGIALGEKILSKKYVLPDNKSLFDFKTYVLVGDGDLMEGISYEACSLAGSYNLNNLIILYDSNNMSLDGSTSNTFKENVRNRFKSMGFNTYLVKDGNSIRKIDFAITRAKNSNKPSFIEIKTKLGNGSVLEGTNKVHGGVISPDDLRQLKDKLNMPQDKFYVNNEALNFMQQKIVNRVNKKYFASSNIYNEYVSRVLNGNRSRISYLFNKNIPANIINYSWNFKEKEELRNTNNYVLETLVNNIPILIGGSADLATSTKTYIKEVGDITPNSFDGKNIWFGVREQAMGAILNGLSLLNYRPYGSTFLSFADYLKPSIRMSALMKLPVIYIFTHDSVSIGSDGPTHQPIEQLAMLRATPNLNVYRPADGKELVGCYQIILNSNFPSALVLSRSEVNLLKNTNMIESTKGAYIYLKEQETLKMIIVATGSEVQLATNIVIDFPKNIRIVSMPSKEIFESQSLEYRKQVLPDNIKTVVIEAGCKYGWEGIATSKDYLITIDTFGKSGSKEQVINYVKFDYASVREKIEKIYNV